MEISVQGPDRLEDLEALAEWLGAEEELRGLITRADAVPGPGELGTLHDTLVAAVSAGGALTVLAASLKAFLSQPRGAKVRIELTRPDGSKIEVDADRLKKKSVTELTAQVLNTGSAGPAEIAGTAPVAEIAANADSGAGIDLAQQ